MSDDPTRRGSVSPTLLQQLTPDQVRQLLTANAVPVVHVTNIHVSVSAVEVAVVLGRAHQMIDPNTNAPLPGSAIEWFQSLSITPIAAKQIQSAFHQAITIYERSFGRIPEDPNFQLAPMPDTPARREGD
jgi:hypothetical protein